MFYSFTHHFCVTCKEYLSFSAWFHSFAGHHPPKFCIKQETAPSGQPAGSEALERPQDTWSIISAATFYRSGPCYTSKKNLRDPQEAKRCHSFGSEDKLGLCLDIAVPIWWLRTAVKGAAPTMQVFQRSESQIPRLNFMALIPPATVGQDKSSKDTSAQALIPLGLQWIQLKVSPDKPQPLSVFVRSSIPIKDSDLESPCNKKKVF